MARHRINENGHMIWFDSDEEYNDYVWNKKKWGCLGTIVAIIFFFVMGISGSKDQSEKDSKKNQIEKSDTNPKYKEKASSISVVDVESEDNDDGYGIVEQNETVFLVVDSSNTNDEDAVVEHFKAQGVPEEKDTNE